MYICLCICTYIPKYNLFSLYKITHIFIVTNRWDHPLIQSSCHLLCTLLLSFCCLSLRANILFSRHLLKASSYLDYSIQFNSSDWIQSCHTLKLFLMAPGLGKIFLFGFSAAQMACLAHTAFNWIAIPELSVFCWSATSPCVCECSAHWLWVLFFNRKSLHYRS